MSRKTHEKKVFCSRCNIEGPCPKIALKEGWISNNLHRVKSFWTCISCINKEQKEKALKREQMEFELQNLNLEGLEEVLDEKLETSLLLLSSMLSLSRLGRNRKQRYE